MDASFHLIKQSLISDGSLNVSTAALLATVDQSLSAAEKLSSAKAAAIDIMLNMPVEVRMNAVNDLVTGGNVKTSHSIDKAIRDYPLMSIAIAYRDFDAAAIIEQDIHALQSRLSKINSIAMFKK